MAIVTNTAYRIDPLDFNPNIGVGVAVPFNTFNVFTTNYTTKDQLKSNLINFLLTNPGERLFDPLFGLGLRSFIFENITTISLGELKSTLSQGISTYFPSLKINNLQVNASPDQNIVNIIISYSLPETNIEDTLSLNFQQ